MRRARQSMRRSPGIIPRSLRESSPPSGRSLGWPRLRVAGRGRTALRYLAAYVKKSAFSEGRLLGYDQSGRIVLSYRDSADGKLKSEALDPLEFIRRWLLDVLRSRSVGATLLHWVRSVSARLPAARLDEPSETDPRPLRTDVSTPKAQKTSAPAWRHTRAHSQFENGNTTCTSMWQKASPPMRTPSSLQSTQSICRRSPARCSCVKNSSGSQP